jgi:hypothetical protein
VVRPLTAFLAALPAIAFAQEFTLSNTPDTLTGGKVTAPPTIDGTVNADEWAGAATGRRQLVVIGPNVPSGNRAQYWIGYDEKYIYVAARMHLGKGGKVQADEFRDNVNLGSDDSVTLLLDINGNNQEFNVFSFNAAGATQLQLAGGRAAKREWGGGFESRGRVTEDGWEGEARIAWDLLPLQNSGPRDVKYLFDWYVNSAQRGESSHSTQGDLTKIHVLRGMDVPNIPRRASLLFLPYAYVGYDNETQGHIANAGLDVKTQINEQLNTVLTINPDFRNIESEVLNLDFSNFERLPGETRPFFLEGNEFILTGGINNRRLFASQRIGEFDAGLNFYGTLSPQVQIGTIGMIDFDNEHSFVGSLTYNPNPLGNVFASFTALDRPGEENYGANLEYFQRTGNYMMFAGYQHTDDEIDGIGTAFGTGWRYQALGFTNVILWDQVSPDFNPRIGFAPQRGYKGPTTDNRWTKTHPRGPIMETQLNASLIDQDMYEGGHYRTLGTTSAGATFRNGFNVTLSYTQDHFLDDTNMFHSVQVSMPRFESRRGWSLAHTRGAVMGLDYQSTTARVFYRPIKRLQLDLRYQKVEHATISDQTLFTFNWEMDKYRALGGRVVGQDDDWNWFVSYRMAGNLGAEYFIIWGDPNATTFQKTLVFKVTVPFTVR